MSVILDIDMPKTARDCIFNQPAPFRGDFCVINNVCTFPDGCPLHKVPEQKTGKWIEYPECLGFENALTDGDIVCSCCEHVFNILDNCTEEFDYCPNCGAKMEGGA